MNFLYSRSSLTTSRWSWEISFCKEQFRILSTNIFPKIFFFWLWSKISPPLFGVGRKFLYVGLSTRRDLLIYGIFRLINYFLVLVWMGYTFEVFQNWRNWSKSAPNTEFESPKWWIERHFGPCRINYRLEWYEVGF